MKSQYRCRVSEVVRPLGSVMIAASGALNVIVNGATLLLVWVGCLYVPNIDCPFA